MKGLKFTEITSNLKYPKKLKAKLSTDHARIIEYATAHYQNSKAFKTSVITALNSVTYANLCGDTYDIEAEDMLSALQLYDNETLFGGIEEQQQGLYIVYKDIEWDIKSTATSVEIKPKVRKTKASEKAEPEKTDFQQHSS